MVPDHHPISICVYLWDCPISSPHYSYLLYLPSNAYLRTKGEKNNILHQKCRRNSPPLGAGLVPCQPWESAGNCLPIRRQLASLGTVNRAVRSWGGLLSAALLQQIGYSVCQWCVVRLCRLTFSLHESASQLDTRHQLPRSWPVLLSCNILHQW